MASAGTFFCGLLLSALAGAAMADQPSGLELRWQGERIFKNRCVPCHTIEPGAGNATGPNLFGVTQRGQANVRGYSYSDALLRNRGEAWTADRLDRFLQSPRKFAPGTLMTFPGMPAAPERGALIAFLLEQSE